MNKDLKHIKGKIFFIFGFLVLSISLIPAKKIAVLPALEKPRAMELDKRHICVLERYSVSIFSSRNFELIKKIGKRGEGPGEWTLPFKFKMYPDMLVINSLRKLLVFSREGSLIFELRKKDIRLSFIWPVGKHFVGLRANTNPNTGLSVTIAIINKRQETLKEISVLCLSNKVKENSSVTQENAFSHYSNFHVYNDSIFIADTRRGFYIEVFNSDGQLLYKIDKKGEVEPIAVTEKIKSEFLKRNKNSDDIKLGRMFGKKVKYTFPKYFPAFKRIFINNGKIYAITFIKKSNKNEIIIMDLKGKILKRVFLELRGKCLQVFDGSLYYLNDNLINEEWELFCEPID
jgi:hypothetical protein